jgi:hypothetical protein
MKRFCILFLLYSFTLCLSAAAQQLKPGCYTADIDHFWQAFDRIRAGKDSAAQYQALQSLFLDPGTPGLKAIMKARNYTPKSYIDAINRYPEFWASIRANTLKAKSFAAAIEKNVLKLKQLYPELKPAAIYFTVGALRTGGTTLDGQVLIGSEIALADDHTVSKEFPAAFSGLKTFFKSNPIGNVVFTNVHEYVHTQQKTTIGNTLLAQCILEGVAEFLAVQATGQASSVPAMAYGRAHEARVREVFSAGLFSPETGYWLYSNAANEFGVRDLGYYVGYAICEKYYPRAADKQQAVKQMIELDYNDQAALIRFADLSGYFEKPAKALKAEFEAGRPEVTALEPFANHAASVAPGLTQITLKFSAPMDQHYRNFELGPLGQDHLLKIKRFVAFSADGTSATFEAELLPGKHYELSIGSGFMDLKGRPLIPYLVDFSTGH